MSHVSYDDIAEWYDHYLRESPLYREVFLLLPGDQEVPSLLLIRVH